MPDAAVEARILAPVADSVEVEARLRPDRRQGAGEAQVVDEAASVSLSGASCFQRGGGWKADSGTVWDLRKNQIAPEVQAVLRALKKRGMILADNGSDNSVSGARDSRWDSDVLRQLKRVTSKNLEIVEVQNAAVDRRR